MFIIKRSMSSSTPRLFQGVKQLLPYIVKSSKGIHVETECGRKFIDFTCGIGVTNLGHSHDNINKAVIEAVPNLVHAQQNIMQHRPMVNLINELYQLDISKRAKLDAWFFWNSGSEAVEGAVKLARQVRIKQNCELHIRHIYLYVYLSISLTLIYISNY